MSDRYQNLIQTPFGQTVARQLGLPNPVVLERYREGAPLVDGSVYVGGDGRLRPALSASLDELGIKHLATHADEATYKGLVFDASGLAGSEELVELQRFFTPVLRSLQSCGRVVVLGTPPEHAESAGSRVAQRALEGFTRSLAKEVGRGSTVQLVYVAPGGERAIA
jgi:3-oxoacyl-[acyl-carrier protein] reductase